ncbi:hypothetical protein [Leptolyngbya sp. FACHB-17]|uniref:hypothetical protein n=1 Tax=unclassified Leptolyngbya TaxID=2650499 RepID=UPI001680DD17|nr:hypothetical protein [Leptolyngbya sp. FACHB-17]MBD2079582.1 hypothetical protein [Leptolyngbya sp. FACHB-17]
MRRTIAASLGLAIALWGSSTRAEETRVIDNTPSAPSICQITPNENLSYGKPVRIVNDRGGLENVVFDRDYTDEFSGMFSGKATDKLYFSSWFSEGLLFSVYWKPQGSDRWTLTGQPVAKFFIKINGQSYELTEIDVNRFCVYGRENLSWGAGAGASPTPIALKLSDEAKTELKSLQQAGKVSIVYQQEQGNKTRETEVPIGNGTINAWKQLEIVSPKSTSEKSKGNPMEAKIRRYQEGWKLYGSDTQGWVERVNTSKDKYDGFYSAHPNVNCRTHPSLRAPIAYVVPKTYTLLPWYAGRVNPRNPNDFWLAVSPGVNQICWMHRSVIGGGD